MVYFDLKWSHWLARQHPWHTAAGLVKDARIFFPRNAGRNSIWNYAHTGRPSQ